MAALILAATATMGRLFLAAAGDAALAQELRAAGGVPALAIVMFSSFEPDTVDSIDASARSAVRVHGPGLAPAVRTMLGPSVPAAAGGRVTSVQLAARDGFAAHIHPIARTFGQGVWMPDTAARLLGIRPGQTLTLGTGPSVEVRVVGVYRDLACADGPLDPFWSPLSSSIYTANAERNPAARLLLVDPDRLAQLGSALDMHGRLEWDFYPGPGPLTLPRSQALVTDIQRVEGAVGDPLTPLGKLRATTSSSLAQLVDRARITMATLTGPVEAISLAGRLLALALVAGAGVYGIRRRRAEVLVLTAQGVGGGRIGARSMVEAALAVAIGGALGWAVRSHWLGCSIPPLPCNPRRVTRPGERRSRPWSPAWCCMGPRPGLPSGPRSWSGPTACARCSTSPGGKPSSWSWRPPPCTSCTPAAPDRS